MYEPARPGRGYRTRQIKTRRDVGQGSLPLVGHEQFLERTVRRPKKASKKPASVKK